jgi:hypothetical protein
MKRFVWVIGAGLFTAFNLVVLAANWSISAHAKVADMDSYALRYDYDFKHAVQSIVEDCRVDDDRLRC